ncbi:MAG: phosphoribosylformylglycinamidine cyclo-ligase [Actinobacteria bacterium]|nr:phosphoribosylformylglycinamidine cyclo-ligase [Actinomycetota bacterium]
MGPSRYEDAGVGGQRGALAAVTRHLGPTLDGVKMLTGFGDYASVLALSDELAVAISTDGVGTKTIVAGAMNRYDTIGFDCVAMNVNDVLCVGARPLAMVDYLGVHTLDAGRAGAILEGLGAAAREAGVAVPGGELAQLPEIIGSDGGSPGDPGAFDLVGTCIGTLRPDDLTLGAGVRPGDAIVGIASSGIHSNGLTLARKSLAGAGYGYGDKVPLLGGLLGEALLEPTAIYVRAITALWDAGIETRGLAHITSDGLCNLCRLHAEVGYIIERLPPAPPIFELIRAAGGIDVTEMYRVFNMGVGFVVIVDRAHLTDALVCMTAAGHVAMDIGTVGDEDGVVRIEPAGIAGRFEGGESRFETA